MSRMALLGLAFGWLSAIAPNSAWAEEPPRSQVLFQNVNVFDGKTNGLAKGVDVLVEGNTIADIGKGLAAAPGATLISGVVPVSQPAVSRKRSSTPDAAI